MLPFVPPDRESLGGGLRIADVFGGRIASMCCLSSGVKRVWDK